MKKQNDLEKSLKLRLNRETLAPLNAETLDGVNGGGTWTLTTTVTITASHPWITCPGGK